VRLNKTTKTLLVENGQLAKAKPTFAGKNNGCPKSHRTPSKWDFKKKKKRVGCMKIKS